MPLPSPPPTAPGAANGGGGGRVAAKDEQEYVKQSVDPAFFTAYKGVKRLADDIERVVCSCFAKPGAAAAPAPPRASPSSLLEYSERELFDAVKTLVSEENRLTTAKVALGHAVVACLHLLHFADFKSPLPQPQQNPDAVNAPPVRFTASATPGDVLALCGAAAAAAPSPPSSSSSSPPRGNVSAASAAAAGLVAKARRYLTLDEREEVRGTLWELVEGIFHPAYVVPALVSVISPHQEPFAATPTPKEGAAASRSYAGRFWYHGHVAQCLDRALLRPGGARALIDSLLHGVSEEEAGAYARVTAAILAVPKFVHSAEEFYARLGPQLVSLWRTVLRPPAVRHAAPHAPAATAQVLFEAGRRRRRLFQRYVLNEVALPLALLACGDAAGLARAAPGPLGLGRRALREGVEGKVFRHTPGSSVSASASSGLLLCDAEEVVRCVETLHALVHERARRGGSAAGAGGSLFDLLGGLLPALLALHATLYTSSMEVRHALFEVVAEVLLSDEARATPALLSYVRSHVVPPSLLPADATTYAAAAVSLGTADAAALFHFCPARGGVASGGGVELRFGAEPSDGYSLRGGGGGGSSRRDAAAEAAEAAAAAAGKSYLELDRTAEDGGEEAGREGLGERNPAMVIMDRRVASLLEVLIYMSKKRNSPVPADILADLLMHDASPDTAAPTSPPLQLVSVKLSLSLCEKLGASCLKSGAQAAVLIAFLVDKGGGHHRRAKEEKRKEGAARALVIDSLKEEEEAEAEAQEEEEALQCLTLGLTLLELALTDKIVLSLDEARLSALRATVDRAVCSEPEIAQMLATCKIGLARLHKGMHDGGEAAKGKEGEKEGEEDDDDGVAADAAHIEELYHSALADLATTEPATVGHALIVLTRLVADDVPYATQDLAGAADAEVARREREEQEARAASLATRKAARRRFVVESLEAIFEALVSYLCDDESFVFMQAGKGLSSLCDRYPAETMPLLLERYRPAGAAGAAKKAQDSVRKARMRPGADPAGKLPTPARKKAGGGVGGRPQARDFRLRDAVQEADRIVKLADVLCYAVWRGGLGRMRGAVCDALLERCHHRQEEVVRASAMQALAMLCLNTPNEVLPAVDSVAHLTFDVLALDKSPLCRRAAASVMYHLFTGLGADAVVQLEVHLPKMLEVARDRLRDPDPVLGEYFRLLLEEGNSLRLEMHGAPQQSLFSKANNAF